MDCVENPSKVRVLYNGSVEEVNFRTYMERTAAEFNSGIEGIESYKACAMAAKMYAIHKVLKRAIGLNYDIYNCLSIVLKMVGYFHKLMKMMKQKICLGKINCIIITQESRKWHIITLI